MDERAPAPEPVPPRPVPTGDTASASETPATEPSPTIEGIGRGMPAWVPRAIVLFWLGYAALLVLEGVLSALRSLVIMLLVSLFLSFAMEPAVNRLARRGWRRGAATGLVFLVVVVFMGVFSFAIGSLVFDQVSEFIEEAPQYVQDLEEWINETFDANVDLDDLVDELENPEGGAQQLATDLAGSALEIGAAAVGVLFQMFTIALFTFYLVADGPRLRRSICSLLPPARQRNVLDTWDLAIEKTGGYLYSRLILAGFSASAHAIALSVVGVPFAVALAFWVGIVSQFIPVVGTYIAGALPVVIALLHDPVDGIIVLAFVVVYQQVENYLFAPRVTAQTMSIHPAVAFGAVIAGAGLLGVAGALLALPAAAVLQAIISTIGERHEVVENKLTKEHTRRRNRLWARITRARERAPERDLK
jgi:predicted PurR-regulated permease PerM